MIACDLIVISQKFRCYVSLHHQCQSFTDLKLINRWNKCFSQKTAIWLETAVGTSGITYNMAARLWQNAKSANLLFNNQLLIILFLNTLGEWILIRSQCYPYSFNHTSVSILTCIRSNILILHVTLTVCHFSFSNSWLTWNLTNSGTCLNFAYRVIYIT